MALTVFNQKPQFQAKNDDYVVNYYHVKKYDDNNFLVTVNHGSWVVLDKREFDLLRFNRVNEDEHLKRLLEEKGIILTENNRDFILTSMKNKYHHTQNGTNLHILVPTLRCNQKCIYCHAKSVAPDKNGYDMSIETAKKVVDFIFQSPARAVTIEYQGGEATLNFEVIKFIREYSEELNKTANKEVRWVIVTNFTNLKEEMIDYFIEKRIDLCTSLDGPKELHDHNRPLFGGGSTYDDVVKTINLCRSKGIGMGALPTITQKSLEYPIEIIDEYIKQGFSGIMSRNLNFMGFARQIWKKLGYTPEEYLDFFRKQADYIIEINKKGFPMVDLKLKFILQRMLFSDPRTFTCFGAPCGAVIGQIAYDQDGNIYTCDEARSDDVFKIGNVHTHTYADIIENSACKVIDLTSGLADVSCDNCVWQPYCGTCMVGVYGAQGNVISKHAFDHECKIRYGQTDYLMRKMIYDKDARAIFQHWAAPNKYPFPFKQKNLNDYNERELFIMETVGASSKR